MKRREEILKELRQIAPELEQVLEQNAFRLPDSYLAELSEEILSSINYSESSTDPDTASLNLDSPFIVPADYFENFYALLMQKIAAFEAMEDPALDLGLEASFSVPEGYFKASKASILSEIAQIQETEALEAEIAQIDEGLKVPETYFAESKSSIMAEIAQMEETAGLEDELAAIPNTGLKVPEDYFASLKSAIMADVAAEAEIESLEAEIRSIGDKNFSIPSNYFEQSGEELKSIPALEELDAMKKDVFRVPDGYFETSAANIKRIIAIGEDKPVPGESKVIDLPKKEEAPQSGRVIKMLRYVTAAAAMLTLFMVGSYMFQGGEINRPGFNDQFAELSDNEVNDFWAYLSEDIEDTPGMYEALAMMDSQPEEDIFDLMGNDISPEQMEEFLLEEELWDDSLMEGI